jgi:hypothetical protein
MMDDPGAVGCASAFGANVDAVTAWLLPAENRGIVVTASAMLAGRP